MLSPSEVVIAVLCRESGKEVPMDAILSDYVDSLEMLVVAVELAGVYNGIALLEDSAFEKSQTVPELVLAVEQALERMADK